MLLSVFDLDKTLLKKNSSALFCKYLYKKKIVPFSSVLTAIFYYFCHRHLGLSLQSLHKGAFQGVLLGLPLALLEKEAIAFVKEEGDSLLYLPAFTKLQQAKKEGHFTMILSSSPEFLVAPFAKRFGVNDRFSSKYLVDKDGLLCQIALILEGKEKARLVEEVIRKLSITKEAVTAYSDSYLDLPFLLSAGHKVVVNPDKKLKALSVKQGWLQI